MVVMIVGLGAFFTASQVTSQSSFYSLRGDLRTITAALQRSSVLSASRGELADAPGGNVLTGLTFYQGRFAAGAVQAGGHSVLPWFANDPISPRPNATVPIGSLGGDALSALTSFGTETILTRRFTPSATPVVTALLADQAFFQYRRGLLDVLDAAGNPITGGYRAQLASWFFEDVSPRSGAVPVAYAFDVVNLNTGWCRVRVFVGGGVQMSAIVPLASAPTTAGGGTF